MRCGLTRTDPSTWMAANSAVILPGTVLRGRLFLSTRSLPLSQGPRVQLCSPARSSGSWWVTALQTRVTSRLLLKAGGSELAHDTYFVWIASGKRTHRMLCVMSALESPCRSRKGRSPAWPLMLAFIRCWVERCYFFQREKKKEKKSKTTKIGSFQKINLVNDYFGCFSL